MRKVFYTNIVPCLVLLLSIVLLNPQGAYSQRVQINLQVAPPFSPFLSTYVTNPSKVFLSVQHIDYTNHDPIRLKLKVDMTADNGISFITKPNFHPSRPIVLSAPGQVVQILPQDLYKYIDITNVSYTGIDLQAILAGGVFPEGNYNLCIQAFDYDNNTKLSADAQACKYFPVNYADPPQLLLPLCNDTVTALGIQQLNFTWLPVSAPGASVEYDFILKEMPSLVNVSPSDLMQNDAFPILYEQKYLRNSTLNYNAAMPALKTGKFYVWQVRASDPAKAVFMKNLGRSPVCKFYYKPLKIILPFIPVVKTDNTVDGSKDNNPNGPPVNAPQLIFPKSEYPACEVQALYLSWLGAYGVPGIKYELRIKEWDQSVNAPDQIMKSVAFPTVLSKRDLTNTYYLLDENGPRLQAGKKYIWQIRAYDDAHLGNYKNGGYSEIYVFDYVQQAGDASWVPLLKPECGNFITPLSPQLVTFKWGECKFNFENKRAITYTFQLVELPAQMDVTTYFNAPHPNILFERPIGAQNSYDLSATDLTLTVGKSYGWRIVSKAVNNTVELKSKPCSFIYDYSGQMRATQLLSPENNSMLRSIPQFTWKAAEGLPQNSSVYYMLRVYPIQAMQTAEQAASLKKVVFEQRLNFDQHSFELTPELQKMIQLNQSYAWQVKCYFKDKVHHSSPVWKFTYSGFSKMEITQPMINKEQVLHYNSVLLNGVDSTYLFQWIRVASDQLTVDKCQLTIAEQEAGQTPEQALKNNISANYFWVSAADKSHILISDKLKKNANYVMQAKAFNFEANHWIDSTTLYQFKTPGDASQVAIAFPQSINFKVDTIKTIPNGRSVLLSFAPNTTNACAGYYISKRTANGTWDICSGLITGGYFTDNKAVAGTTCFYKFIGLLKDGTYVDSNKSFELNIR